MSKKKPADLKPGEVAYVERNLFARRTKNGDLNYGISFVDPDGRRVRETVGPSKKLARTVLSKRRTEIAEGRYQFRSRAPAPSVSEICDGYLKYASQHKRSWHRDSGVHLDGDQRGSATPQMPSRLLLRLATRLSGLGETTAKRLRIDLFTLNHGSFLR